MGKNYYLIIIDEQGFMEIKIDDLTGADIIGLLQEHLNDMYLTSPPESVHALDLDGLRQPEITFWSVWENDKLAGCGALKELSPVHAEIKSMRTSHEFRRKGFGALMMQHILNQAKVRKYERLSLETGSMAYFAPARKLYESFGFEYCSPFADYSEDPNSVFMMKIINN
jgi:putative acetyltransferase